MEINNKGNVTHRTFGEGDHCSRNEANILEQAKVSTSTHAEATNLTTFTVFLTALRLFFFEETPFGPGTSVG
jgi:hypothetical protein